MSRTLVILALIAVPVVAPSTYASVTYLTQTRTLTVVAGNNSDSAAALDFLPFNRTLTTFDLNALVSATASQNSELLADRILASGTADPSDGNQGWSGTSRSLFDVTFSVDQPTPFHISGNWATDYGAFSLAPVPTSAFIRLPGVFASEFAFPSGSDTAGASFDSTGTLAPGSYRLWIDFNLTFQYIGSNAGTTHSSYNVLLELPTPMAGPGIGVLGTLFGMRRRAVCAEWPRQQPPADQALRTKAPEWVSG